jgi:hypothetical protein
VILALQKIILRKNDPLLFHINFAKLLFMGLTQESLKYRAEVLKYFGFVISSPTGYLLFSSLTDPKYFFEKLNYELLFITCLISSIGVKCIFRGIDILEKFQTEVKKDGE